MQYIIMLLIIIGLALADFLTGWIKAYISDDVRSAKMRKGGLINTHILKEENQNE